MCSVSLFRIFMKLTDCVRVKGNHQHDPHNPRRQYKLHDSVQIEYVQLPELALTPDIYACTWSRLARVTAYRGTHTDTPTLPMLVLDFVCDILVHIIFLLRKIDWWFLA